ncbi:sporulation integral membrane protein YtvI [uncultured Eubacterium sp.]|uniref:AI-2E family transporter n=1 Tax=Emergencia sp. TaxID=1926557 RepID=UPI000822A0B7|nr:sporulation integral membrane protein YtvI [uncultured Eubacterium sp.]
MRERFKNGYVKLGVTLFAAGAALIVVSEMVTHFDGLREDIDRVNTILSPFIFGLVMAYLLCPVYNAVVRRLYKLTCGRWKTKKGALKFCRVVATIISLVVLIGVVGGLFAMVLPETIRSIIGLVQVMPDRLNDLINWAETTFTAEKYPEAAEAFESLVAKTRDNFVEWTQTEFLPKLGIYMTQISQGVIVTLKTVLNILIGIIICVYFLNSKELFKAQTKKIISATMNKERSDAVFEFAYFTNKTFGGFINGKLIDSAIIGVLCFILMSVLNLPYTILVSTIIGVTNIIPFFGPFIGAIPSAIIICLESPLQAIYFLIMVLVLQQFDGNILGPKILGGTTGLASFWVMFAIIVGGGLFGFLGMVLGVPVFAVVYYYFRKFINRRLAKKNLPTSTIEYEDFNKYDINRKDVL